MKSIDYDLTKLDGGGPAGSSHIDPTHLPMRLKAGKCEPVYPHQFQRLNTIMELIHEADRRTAWSDKHPAYEIISGPSGKGLDELYAPEINSTSVPGQSGADWTTDPSFTRTYDQLKVTAVLNWIKGFDHTGTTKVGVPAIFGMNFQAVSVGEKVTADGYLDAAATPSAQLQASLDFVDASLGQMLDTLADQHLARDTLVIVGAKHGQSPIDVNKLHMLTGSTNPKLNGGTRADVTDPADLLTKGGVALAQETADDVALIWLKNQGDAEKAVAILEADRKGSNQAHIEKIYAGEQLVDQFGDPGNRPYPRHHHPADRRHDLQQEQQEDRRARRIRRGRYTRPARRLESEARSHDRPRTRRKQAGRTHYPEGARPGAGRARGGARRRPYPPAAGPAAKGLILRD